MNHHVTAGTGLAEATNSKGWSERTFHYPSTRMEPEVKAQVCIIIIMAAWCRSLLKVLKHH